MKRRKVAMLMAVLMTASSLSGSYVSAASIEDMEVTAEEIAVQSQETESEAVQMATEGTELPTEEALVLEKTETIQAEMKTESASPEVAESEISVPKSENSETESAAPESETSETETPASETESETEALTETETETPPPEEAAEVLGSGIADTEPGIAVFSGETVEYSIISAGGSDKLLNDEGYEINPFLGDLVNFSSQGGIFLLRRTSYVDGGSVEEEVEDLYAEGIRWRADYDENEWERVDESEDGTGLPELQRKSDGKISVTIFAERYVEESGWEIVAEKEFTFNPVEYSVDFEYSYGGEDAHFLFYGDRSEELTLTLNTEGLTGLKDYKIEWAVIQDKDETKEPTCVDVSVSEDEDSITLTPMEDFNEEGHGLDVEAKVLKDGKEITAAGTHLDVIPTKLDASRLQLENEVLLPGESFELSKDFEFEVWVRDPKHLWEESVNVQLTGVRINDPDEIFSYNGNENGVVQPDEDGQYCIRAKSEEESKTGSADVFLSFAGVADEYQDIKGEWQFSLTANTEKYCVDSAYSTQKGQMICGSGQDIFTSVYREWYGSDGDTEREEITDYTVEVGTDYDQELVTATVSEDQKTIHVEAYENEGGTDIPVYYKIGDQKIGETAIYVNVSKDVYQLEPEFLADENGKAVNPLKGEILDLPAFAEEFKVYHLHYNKETRDVEKTAEPEENIRYLVGYNGDVWSREDDFAEDSAEDYSLPVLRRLEDCETSIWITAEINLAEPDSEKPSWSYAADRSYTFDSVHCEVDLEYSYGERDNCTLFYGERGEALTLILNKDGLNGLTKYDTQWIVTQYCDGEERDVTAVNYDDQDNDQITLVPTADFPEDGSWIHVEAKIMVQENEIASTETDIGLAATECNLQDSLPGDCVLLPDWSYDIDRECWVYVRDIRHPEGVSVPVQITGVSVDDPDGVLRCDVDESGVLIPDEEGNYHVYAVNEEGSVKSGTAELTLSYNYTEDENYKISGEWKAAVMVEGENYDIDFYYGTTWHMQPGDEQDITTSVHHNWYDLEESRHKDEDVKDYTVEVAFDAEWTDFDEELLDVSVADDGQTIHVKAKKKMGGTNIPVRYLVGDQEIGQANIWVDVSEEYYVIEPQELKSNPLIGETLDLSQVEFKVYQVIYNPDKGEKTTFEVPAEELRFWAKYDDNAWIRTDEGDEYTLPVLKRKGTWGTSINVIAEMNFAGEDSKEDDWQQIGDSQNYWFDGFEYQLDLAYSYGGPENSRVYVGAPLTLTAKIDPVIEWNEDISIEWKVFVYDENGERKALDPESISCTKDGPSLTITAKDGSQGNWFQAEAVVMAYGQEIARCEYSIEVRGESYYFTGMENMSVCLFIGQKNGPFFTRDTNGKIWMETYQESGEYPEGKRTKVEVTGIEEDCEEGNELLQITDNEEGIHILPLGKTGQTSMRFLLVDEEGNEVPSISCEAYVQEDYINIIDIEVKRESGEGTCLLPGETLKLQPVLARLFTDENGEIQQEPLEASDYHIVYTDYDENIIRVDEDGTVHTVGRGDSWVTVQVLDAEEQELTSNGLNITVKGKYYQLKTEKENLQVLAPGESLKEQFTPYVYSISRPEGKETEDGTFVIREILNNTEGVHTSISETGLLSVSLDKDTTLRKGSIQSMEIIVEYRDADGNYLADKNYILILCNHDEKVIDHKDATCTEDGYTTYECNVCGSTWKDTLPAAGHTEVADAAVEATCETAGKTEGSHCTTCGKVLKAQETIPAKDHTAVTDTGVGATCEATGKTEGSHCATCGKVLKAQETIPAKGHTAVTDAGVKATCETAGKTEGSQCATCGKVLKAQTTIAATGHIWSAWKTTSEATVFAVAKQQRSCTICKKTETRTVGKKLTKVLKLNVSSISLQIKQKTTAVKVTEMAKGDSVKSWKSSDTKVVRVAGKKNGTCTIAAGTTPGTAKITVQLASGKAARIIVKVQRTAVKTTSITASVKKLTLYTGQAETLNLTVKPLTSEEEITFTSSRANVAAVTKKGLVVAKTAGTTRITAKSGKKSVAITVVVKNAVPTAITGIPTAKTLKKGNSFTLKPVLAPKGVTAKITYTTSNKKVAVVSSNGKVTAKGTGTAVITVKTGKLVKRCRVTVKYK